jgi:transposase InsO family protein
MHHCDRGVQYTAISFGKRLARASITPSMGSTAIALDNAMAKRFIATYEDRTRASTPPSRP